MSKQPQESEMNTEEWISKLNVPKAPVLHDVGVYLQENKQSVDEVADKVKDDFRRYKILEASLTQQRARIQENLIDCRKSLSAIEMLRENKEKNRTNMTLTYKVDENVFSQAHVEEFDKVCLWLGANVMVEYELPEARELLLSNLTTMEKHEKDLVEQLSFLRDQITTSEVNIANIYNYNMQHAKSKESEQKRTKKDGSEIS